jgi:ribosomal protein S18 acetylase RimI-like enzyme/rRNA-processing protein FCF1
MPSVKLLIDTNVFIGLEDQKEVSPEFSKMIELCGKHGVHVFVHEMALEDIKRDKDAARRKVSVSKVKKFELLKKVKQPSTTKLVATFGPMPKPNDVVDVALLHALQIKAVDFVVTQDQGIHNRARRCTPPLLDRVLTVTDAVAWLQASFEPQEVLLPFIEEVAAHSIATDDDIFDSLREGYPEFDTWWQEKCIPNHRACWVATIDGELAGIVVRKEETHAEAKTKHAGTKILKICTFKVKPKFRGEKLGELLLKQILWYAEKNAFDVVYLTTFDEQQVLIRVLEYYGFERTATSASGEHTYEKPLPKELLVPEEGDNLFELARINYPRFVGRSPATGFCVPIQSDYHNILFPELSPQTDNGAAVGSPASTQDSRRPGNTIRKVYLCRAKTKQLVPGSVLLFYRSSSPGYATSQSLTSVGVVEAVTYASSLKDLIRLTAKRSVYSEAALAGWNATKDHPVKVIDFLLIGHLDPVMLLAELQKKKVFKAHPYQSICRLPPERVEPVRKQMKFGFKV